MREIKTRRTRGGDPDKRGRGRAAAMYPDVQPCEVCGKTGSGRGQIDRHHRNSDREDNRPENIAFLCRRHHHAAHRASDGKVGGGPRPRIAQMVRSRGLERAAVAWRLRGIGMADAEIAAVLGVSPMSVPRYFYDRRYREDA